MLQPIDNVPRAYEWGGRGQISALRGRPSTDQLEAELWLGTHPGSPARLSGDNQDVTLSEWIDSDSQRRAGEDSRLPFLLKILHATAPLSLQVHPNTALARAGYERENRLRIDLAAPERNYRDDRAKPEMILALSDTFDALCGFRAPAETASELHALSDTRLTPLIKALACGLQTATEWVLRPSPEVGAAAAALRDRRHELPAATRRTVDLIIAHHPEDPRILLAVMLNSVTLRRGEALFLPAGNVHAYLQGMGVELMGASDNVLRGGLTNKHVDVDELLRVTDFRVLAVPRLAPRTRHGGGECFDPGVADFRLIRVSPGKTAAIDLEGPAIVLALGGSAQVRGSSVSSRVAGGDAVFVTADEQHLVVSSEGETYVATTGSRSA